VRLALVRVTSENLKRVDLSFCHHISAGGMEDILHITCSGVKEVDVTACSNEAVLRAVAIRARAVCGVDSALDLYNHLKSLKVYAEGEQDEEEQDWKRYPFSYLSRLLHASTPLLLFDPELAPRKNALFQAAAHGTGSDVAMLLSLSFAVENDEGDIRTFDVNDEDKEGDSPLLLACRSGNLEIAEILVVAGAGVSAANYRGDTPLLAAVGAGKLKLAEMLVSKGADVNDKDSQGNSPLLLACRSGNLEIPEILVCAGAGVSATNYRGDTPLLAAVGAGKVELAEMLVRKGADVNVINGDGASALHLGIASDSARSFEMFETLLKAGADLKLNVNDSMGETLMVTACRVGNFEVFEKLLKAGADVNVVRRDGASVFFFSPMHHHDVPHSHQFFFLRRQRFYYGVVWVNKPPVQHACRWTIQAGRAVNCLAYSVDGSRLARAERNDVVVCDAVSGFEVHRLKGHR
jgi:ankyrin repeat protein